MKRVLILALVLLFVGWVAFADMMAPAAPKWSLWSEGDLYAYSTNGNWGWGTGWAHMQNEVGGWYTTLGVNYDGKDYGYMAQLEFGQDLLAGLTAASYTENDNVIPVYLFRQFDAYYKLFDGAVKITGGKILDGEYSFSDFVEGDNLTYWMGSSVMETYGSVSGHAASQNIYVGDFGGMIQIYPMPGLNIGIGVAVPSTSFEAYWATPQSAQYMDSLSVAVQYAAKDLFTVNASIRANGGIVDVNAQYFGMKNLTANIGIEDATSVGTSNFGQYFAWLGSLGYTMSPLTVGIMTGGSMLTFSGAPTGGAGADWAVEGMVEYVIMGNMSVGARVGYENTNFGTPINGWMTGNVEGLTVYPYIVAKYDNGSSVQVGFQWTSGLNQNYVPSVAAQSSYWSIPVKFTVAF